MIYNGNNTFQKRFISGRYTLTYLLASAVLLWIINTITAVATPSEILPLSASLMWVEQIAAFMVYMAVALILNSFVIIEGRTPWLGGIFMLFTGLFPVIQNLHVALISLLHILGLAVLFSCYQRNRIQQFVYWAFAFLGLWSLFLPASLLFLPLFLFFMYMVSVMSVRNILAAMLGLLTPYWLSFCLLYIFPIGTDYTVIFNSVFEDVTGFYLAIPTVSALLFCAVESLTVFPAAVILSRSISPAKPLMRKMLTLFIVMNIYMSLLSFFRVQETAIWLAWQLPGIAVAISYVFSLKQSKLSNICFVILNISWLLVAFMGLWNLY